MNFSFRRVYAVILRNFYADKRSMTRLVDLFYYPAIDVVLWGITTQWIEQTAASRIIVAFGVSLVLWQVVARTILEISIGIVEELWNRSIINLFSSPLQLSEWITAFMISSICKNFFVLPYGALLVWFVFGINIFQIGFMIIPYLILLLTCGWTIGLLGASIIMYWGRRAQSTPWMIAWMFVPLCAIYYPVANLPRPIQIFSLCTPLAHVFEAVRYQVIHGSIAYEHLGLATLLACIYLSLSIALFFKTFKRALRNGLTSLE